MHPRGVNGQSETPILSKFGVLDRLQDKAHLALSALQQLSVALRLPMAQSVLQSMLVLTR
jgi:hypothetical protein